MLEISSLHCYIVIQELENYQLTVSGGTGDGDGGIDTFAYHNGCYFTTCDRENDIHEGNCAYLHQGGWWYKNCFYANLNGRHKLSGLPGTHSFGQLLNWYSGGQFMVYTNSGMKIRSKTCCLGC